MILSPIQRVIRAFFAWGIVAIFVFPIYYWVSVAFKAEREIFSRPPTVFSFTPSVESFEEVFGISLGFERGLTVLPGTRICMKPRYRLGRIVSSPVRRRGA